MTDPVDQAHLLRDLPADVSVVGELLQGIAVHRDHAEWRFGFTFPEERQAEGTLRRARDVFAHLVDLRPRPPQERYAATCRQFCLLLCSMLRQAEVPARIRGGYADYFPRLGGPRLLDDHWVVEYWTPGAGWRLADVQTLGSARTDYGLPFDPADVPRDRFLVAGEAWRLCRRGEIDPERFIVSGPGERGPGVVPPTLVRDLAALNHVECQPWETWGLAERPLEAMSADDLVMLDRIAEVTSRGDGTAARALYAAVPELRPNAEIRCYTDAPLGLGIADGYRLSTHAGW